MTSSITTGINDFRRLREQGLTYVDRSLLVRDVLDHEARAVLRSGPRGSGKTLDLSMLRCFFEKREEDLSGLFVDLAIARAGDAYVDEFQRYPVVWVSFAGFEAATWEHAWIGLQERIERAFDEHAYLLDSSVLSEGEARDYRAVLAGVGEYALYETALLDLCRYLRLHHGEKVVILVDDYDEPLHAGAAGGYEGDVVGAYDSLLRTWLKGNPHLFKAVLTGRAAVGGEGLFPELGSLAVLAPVQGE